MVRGFFEVLTFIVMGFYRFTSNYYLLSIKDLKSYCYLKLKAFISNDYAGTFPRKDVTHFAEVFGTILAWVSVCFIEVHPTEVSIANFLEKYVHK